VGGRENRRRSRSFCAQRFTNSLASVSLLMLHAPIFIFPTLSRPSSSSCGQNGINAMLDVIKQMLSLCAGINKYALKLGEF